MRSRITTLAALLFAGALIAAGSIGTAAGSTPDSTALLAHQIVAPPAVKVGDGPVGLALYPATHTLYTSNQNDNTVSVVSTLRCRAGDLRGCGQRVHSIALAPGANPQGIVVDTATRTAYVADIGTNTIAVLDLRHCNAESLSGCGHEPAGIITDAGAPINMAVNPVTHTVYVANIGAGTVSVIDTATCNGHRTAGCAAPPPTVAAGGGADAVAIDAVTDTVYVADDGPNGGADDNGRTVSVIDGATCSGVRHSGCGQVAPTIAVGEGPYFIAVDQASHTAYTANNGDNTVSVINTATCNARTHAGCGQKTAAIPVGAEPYAVSIDPKLHRVFVANAPDDTLSLIDIRTCDAANRTGCRHRPPETETGGSPAYLVTDPATGTVYSANSVADTVSVIAAGACDGANTAGCRHDEPTAAVGAGPSGIALDQRNHTVYVANATSDTVSVLDADACNAARLAGCRHPAATVRLDSVKAAIGPTGIAVDEVTGTVYVADFGSDTVSVIDARTCNATRTSGCAQHPRKIRVGSGPSAVAVDPSTDTVYVADAGPTYTNDLVSVINGATCNATQHGGCGQTAATVTVGIAPRGIAVDEATHTVYVANTGEFTMDILGDTVSVINAAGCNGIRHSGCTAHPATIRVGRYPFGVAVDQATNMIYVADNDNGDGPDELTTINGAVCDAAHTAGCAHPAGTVNEPGRSARNVALDVSTHTLYVTGKSDASVSVIDLAKPASIPDSPRLAVGSFPEAIVFDPANHTVYVANEVSNTVSVLPAVR